jgi:hypothetical protein
LQAVGAVADIKMPMTTGAFPPDLYPTFARLSLDEQVALIEWIAGEADPDRSAHRLAIVTAALGQAAEAGS